MPVVLLEGCDCVGKSTLADAIAAIWGERGAPAVIIHRGPPPEDVDILDEYITSLNRAMLQVDDDDTLFILDRWHIGEMVYGPIYRGRSRLTFKQFMEVDAFLRGINVLQVVLSAPEDILAARFLERGETFTNPVDIGKILNGFQSMASVAGPHVLRIDTTAFPTDDLAQQLIERTHVA